MRTEMYFISVWQKNSQKTLDKFHKNLSHQARLENRSWPIYNTSDGVITYDIMIRHNDTHLSNPAAN